MPLESRRPEEQYSTWTGLIYIFNLIVGTGALTLPAVFNKAGWALGLSVICILAFISFITVTFVIETMASANAIVQWKRLQQMKRALQANEPQDEDTDEDTPLFSPVVWEKFPSQPHRYYIIHEKIEMLHIPDPCVLGSDFHLALQSYLLKCINKLRYKL